MGLTKNKIYRIVLTLGGGYSLIGIAAGVVIGVALVMAQKHWGLYKLADGLQVQYYPVELKITDVLVIISTIFALSILVSVPAARLAKNMDLAFKQR